MERESNINSILEELIKSGSEIDYLKDLKKRSLEIVKKDIDLSEVLNEIAKEIKEQTESFLNQKNQYDINYISGISTCIYLPDFNNNGEYKLKLIGGTTSRNKDLKVNERTMFDIASITKLYTLLLLFKLEEKGIINLNDKICDINPDFQNLEDFTLNDLVRLHGDLRTNGNITQATSKEEAYELLKTLYLNSNTREENKYTDFGAIVIGDTIEKVVSRYLGKEMTFEEIMHKYLLDPIFAINTQFNPYISNLSGNGNDFGLVHDPKARILGGAVGHAGIFTTSDDLARLSKEIYSVKYYSKSLISKSHLDRLGEITFPNSSQSNKGHLGLYVKHPLGYAKTFTPPEFSKGSFSHQGWTGSVATFDPNNLIHNSILVNAIYEDDEKEKVRNDKPIGFGTAFEEYQRQITKNIMLMYIAKQYFNRYCNVKENINITKYI
ncbi:MAG: serine hydrolase [Bacilli bacterium]|nr:serine hydrolase [Bacilli bacterium]